MITKTFSDGSVELEYNPSHSNHELEIKYLTLNIAEKENIAGA